MFKILAPIIITAAAAGLFFLQTSPTMDRVRVAESERVAYSDAEKSSEQYQELLKAKNAVFNNIDDSKKESLKKFLPDSIDNVKLIIDINQIASDKGMTIRNISIKGGNGSSVGPDTRPYGVATLGFSVTGTYQTFKDFLKDLETSLRLIDVTSVSFSSGDKDQNEYNIEVNSYWLKQ
ncbi:MAG: type 4a pilus biogenesis protein PilO [Candidatus Vogelbacteria bacterium]|nr:type 4a pilus biogenesis protein PilO [Candidatus Vogelbacteria bacterium]